jgi:glutathione synthase/RimK-type ligase-like ATP-grasp enzyme
MRLALATSADLPDLDPDERLLIAPLARLGIEAKAVVWEGGDFGSYDACVIRSTWGYFKKRDAYLAWTRAVAAKMALFNPPEIVVWNTHKGYLRELEARGVPVVPTVFVERGVRADLASQMQECGWNEAVVKPAVSAGGFATTRVRLGEGQGALDAIVASGDAMIQPYLCAVEGRGEVSIIAFDGVVSHAIRKFSAFEKGWKDGDEPALDATEHELRLAKKALDALGRTLLYARIDVADGPNGAPCLMELELTEPSLFLRQGGAAERFARAIARRIGIL